MLVEKARAVVLITGTTGWEALLRGKAAICFGYPWYLKAPGLVRVDGIDSCQRALSRIDAGESLVDERAVARFALAMRDKVLLPIIYTGEFVPSSKLTPYSSAVVTANLIAETVASARESMKGAA